MARKKTNEKICITLFKKYKSNALKRKLDFNLDIDYLWELFINQNKKCAITGVGIEMVNATINGNYHLQTSSLDRIDSNKGYVVGNVQWVHKVINSLKSDFENDDFLSLCFLVSSSNPSHTSKNINDIRPVKKRMSENVRGNMRKSNPHKKPIIQLDLENKIIKYWGSINEARDFYKYKSEMGIIGTCKGRQKSSGGFIWKYQE